ncbi:hypothetical protein C2U27_03440 [Bacillus aerophilus]|nr:hypothetical protein [Bacillus aerophilus]
MKKAVLECNCGTKHLPKQEIKNAGDVMREGWGIVPSLEGKLIKLCPKCHSEVNRMANKTIEITGSRYISLSSLRTTKEV